MSKTLKYLVVLALAAAPALVAVAQAPRTYDLVIRNARIVDGSGAPWFRGDLAVTGDTIVALGQVPPGQAARTVDAGQMVVAPGFIDIHTHARRGIFVVPTADNYTRQGVTTLVEGPDGDSPIPLAPFLAKVAATGISPNFASQYPNHARSDGRAPHASPCPGQGRPVFVHSGFSAQICQRTSDKSHCPSNA